MAEENSDPKKHTFSPYLGMKGATCQICGLAEKYHYSWRKRLKLWLDRYILRKGS